MSGSVTTLPPPTPQPGEENTNQPNPNTVTHDGSELSPTSVALLEALATCARAELAVRVAEEAHERTRVQLAGAKHNLNAANGAAEEAHDKFKDHVHSLVETTAEGRA